MSLMGRNCGYIEQVWLLAKRHQTQMASSRPCADRDGTDGFSRHFTVQLPALPLPLIYQLVAYHSLALHYTEDHCFQRLKKL